MAMKTPQKGRWTVPLFKRTARTFFLGNSILATLLVLVLLLVSCGAADSATGSSGNQSTSFTGQHVHIVGSSALQPLAAKAADLFHQQHPEVKIDVQGGGSGVGLSAVINHQAEIGDSDIYADPTQYPDPNLTDHIVCITPMAMIVNPEVNIAALNTQQVIEIYTGVITNWRDVGGPNLPIVPLVKPTTSGTRALFDKYVLGTTAEVGQPVTDASTVVVDTVAHTPGAISYTSVTTINSTVQTIALDGAHATAQDIQSGKYRFWGFEHMYTLQNGIDATTAFLDFMQTSQIQQLAVSLGYLSANTVSNSRGG
jgi:phosphate transport system substrate-binding protein